VGCPIRKSADQSLFAAPHGLSQRITSFIACACQGIHQMPLRHLIVLIANGHHYPASANLSSALTCEGVPKLAIRTHFHVPRQFSQKTGLPFTIRTFMTTTLLRPAANDNRGLVRSAIPSTCSTWSASRRIRRYPSRPCLKTSFSEIVSDDARSGNANDDRSRRNARRHSDPIDRK
jgi:hypothetical protein